jgi:16S rRNA (cytidine1402-2'-O)-methyltransferase
VSVPETTADHARLAAAVAARLEGLLAQPLAPGLYVVATPIGNLGDITLRALAVLAAADMVYCEDTRHTRTLMSAFGLSQRLAAYHEHNAEATRPRILEALAAGQRIALVSDAGTPLVSDPGYKLVRAAIEAGRAVIAAPGASAVTAALASAGLATDRFLFLGFLPTKAGARREAISAVADVAATLVLFESPGRLGETLADLAAGLGDRPAVVARELTKLHEELLRGPLSELAASVAGREIRGEIVVLVGPSTAPAAAVTNAQIADSVRAALADSSLRDAVQTVAEALEVPRRRVYDIALALKRDADA